MQSTMGESDNKTKTIGRVNQYSLKTIAIRNNSFSETIRENNRNGDNRSLLVTWTLTLPSIHGPDIESPIGGDDITLPFSLDLPIHRQGDRKSTRLNSS